MKAKKKKEARFTRVPTWLLIRSLIPFLHAIPNHFNPWFVVSKKIKIFLHKIKINNFFFF